MKFYVNDNNLMTIARQLKMMTTGRMPMRILRIVTMLLKRFKNTFTVTSEKAATPSDNCRHAFYLIKLIQAAGV